MAAIPRAYRPLIARYGGGSFDKWSRRNYGVTGYGLLARLIKGESGFRQGAVSSKQARSITQFIPSTRRAFIDRYNVDPWKNEASAVRAAKIHLTKWGGLRGYNPGMGNYPSYILGQNVGNVRRMLRRTGHLDPKNRYTGKGYEALREFGGRGAGTRAHQLGQRKGGEFQENERGGKSAKAAGTPQSLRQLIAGGPTSTPVAGSAPQEPAFSSRANLRLPELAGEVPGSEIPAPRTSSQAQIRELTRLLSSTPTTPPVPVAPPLTTGVDLPTGVGGPPPGGYTFRLGKGTPKPLNPRRFDVSKSGKRATLKVGKNRGEVIGWNGRRWVFIRGGQPVRGLKWSPAGGPAEYGVTPGRPQGAPIDRAGVPTSPTVRRFVNALAGTTPFPVVYGTGSQHSQMTSSGNVSEHWHGNAIDLPAAGRRLRIMGTKALRLVGKSRAQARQMAFRGGIYNVNYRGRRYQIIVRTRDHWDHLHVGIQG